MGYAWWMPGYLTTKTTYRLSAEQEHSIATLRTMLKFAGREGIEGGQN